MLQNLTTGETLAGQVELCNTFWTRLRGLMFRRGLDGERALVFVCGRESIVEAAVTMFFVFYPIAVLWLDAQRRVVDTALAKPFRPCYASRHPARYYVEGAPELLERVEVGDELSF